MPAAPDRGAPAAGAERGRHRLHPGGAARRRPGAPAPLPSAEPEAAQVAKAYTEKGVPARALLGPAARQDTLRGLMSDPATAPTCVHLAVHGSNVESDTPLESWLLLAASRLDGLHLVHWRLDGATVVLSACCSGQRAIGGRGMAELPGDDLFGLQGAFFAAGARQVLGALWQVEGGIARPLTLAFHRGLLDGLPADVALRRATLHHLDTDLLFTRLAHWAPFFLMCLGTPQPTTSGSPA
ncbi:CHAT domain-containing protein [Phytohabitans rumicis]|uniref:CHAT domain-containing protein n=1 Tax=Phytohabitans rumicis TaxID=1076125 RepID=UPI0035317908